MESDAEVSDPEAASKIKAKKRDSIADVTTLDIKSRLSLETTEARGGPHVNGVAQVNGICDSPQRTATVTDLSPQSKTMETSHLNQHGIQRQLTHCAVDTINSVCIRNNNSKIGKLVYSYNRSLLILREGFVYFLLSIGDIRSIADLKIFLSQLKFCLSSF